MRFLRKKVVSVRSYSRPDRIAFVINRGNPSEKLSKVIEWCSSTLGGPYSSIFSFSSLKKDFFEEMFFDHDPDFVISVGKNNKTTQKTIDRLQAFSNEEVSTLESLTRIHLAKYLDFRKMPKFKVSVSTTPRNHRLFLPSIAIHGLVSESDKRLLGKFLDFDEVDYSRTDPMHLLTSEPYSRLVQWSQNLLAHGTQPSIRSYELIEHDERRLDRILVIDDPENVEGISLFWNLRAMYPTNQTYLLPRYFFKCYEQDVRDFLWSKGALTDNYFTVFDCSSRPQTGMNALRNVFRPDRELEGKNKNDCGFEANDKKMHFHLASEELRDILGKPNIYYTESSSSPVSFSDEGGYIPCPKAEIGLVDPMAYHALDLDIQSSKFPKSNTLKFGLGMGSADRISRSGITVLRGWIVASDDPFYLRIINDLEAINCLVEDVGLTAKASDKGKRAIQLLSLLEHGYELRFLSGDTMIDLLYQCNPYELSNGRLKPDVESAVDYDTIKRILQGTSRTIDSRFVTSLIDWMLMTSIMKLGTIVKCDRCYNKQWVPIHEIREKVNCQGCLSSMQIPIDHRSLRLYYVINTLVGNAITQGFLCHLLAYCHLAFRTDEVYSNLTFFYPGVNICKNDRTIGELDFFMVSDGEIIVGECKQGRELTESEIKHAVRLAKRVNADVIAFCTLRDFSKGCVDEILRVGKKNEIKTAILNGAVLRNQSYYREVQKEIADRKGKSVSDLDLYHRYVLSMLRKD